jgi:hypothetical protein
MSYLLSMSPFIFLEIDMCPSNYADLWMAFFFLVTMLPMLVTLILQLRCIGLASKHISNGYWLKGLTRAEIVKARSVDPALDRSLKYRNCSLAATFFGCLVLVPASLYIVGSVCAQ